MSCEKLLGLLPEELRESYRPLLHESDPGVARIVKAADKLSAYIKCVEELKAGNREFESAARQTREALTEMHLPCLDYFMAHFLDAFQLTLDTSLYTREALAAAAGFGQTGSSAPANRTGTIKKSRLRRAAIFDCTSYLMLSCTLRVVLVTAGTVVVSLETVTSPANILATSAL